MSSSTPTSAEILRNAQPKRRGHLRVFLGYAPGVGKTFRMLCQGIAWIDKASFHLLQLRTDLLAPRPEVGLDQQTTKITYSEVRFADLATPLWLPHDVNVYIRFTDLSEALQYGNQGDVVDLGPHVTDQTFRNMHRYSNYQRYRVSTKILQSH